MAAAAERAGTHMACRPGCTECCIGPFPINALDAERLRRGMKFLLATDPARAARVRARAAAQVADYSGSYPGDPETGTLLTEDREVDAFLDREDARPCPALDPSAGTCDLYAWRPVSCRICGLPMRIGGQRLPPCSLCFVGAGASEVESCRIDPDPEGIEGRLLADRTETVVAFALL